MFTAFGLFTRIQKLHMCFVYRDIRYTCWPPWAQPRDLISAARDRFHRRIRRPENDFGLSIAHPREILLPLELDGSLQCVGGVWNSSTDYTAAFPKSPGTFFTAVRVKTQHDREVDSYARLTHFIDSLRPTLVTLVLELGIITDSTPPCILPHRVWTRVG